MTIIVVFIIVTILFLSKKRWALHLGILILALLFASRTDLIPDAQAYRFYYEQYEIPNLEKGYLSFSKFFSKNLQFSFGAFLFILSFTLLELWLWTTKRLSNLKDVGIQFALMLSYFGFYYYGIVLRSSIAISIVYAFFPILLHSTKLYKYLVFVFGVLFAIQFHQTAIIYLLVPIFLFKINDKYLYMVNVVSLALLLSSEVIPIQTYMESAIDQLGYYRFNTYLSKDLETERANLIAFLFVAISFVAVFYKDKINYYSKEEVTRYSFITNMTVFGTLLNSLVWQIPAMSRLSSQWLFFEGYILYMILFRNKSKAVYNYRYPISIAICFIQFFALLHYYPLIMNY
ncbi:EpsG family protein [Xylanibacter brevis]|uniref:EpsG family protein n=1 Tax=Xylanibacter brevis TaxID=83231 RepID=UPI00047F94C2